MAGMGLQQALGSEETHHTMHTLGYASGLMRNR